MKVKRYEVTASGYAPTPIEGAWTNVTTFNANAGNSGVATVKDAQGVTIATLNPGASAIDFVNGQLADLYSFEVTGGDKLHVSTFLT